MTQREATVESTKGDTLLFSDPTPKAEWVKAGDWCISMGAMVGKVERVTECTSLPYATVVWENGVRGRVSITTIRPFARPTNHPIERFFNRDYEFDGRFDALPLDLRKQLTEEREEVIRTLMAVSRGGKVMLSEALEMALFRHRGG